MSPAEDGGAVEAGLRAATSEIERLQGDLASCRLRRDAWKQGFDERSALVAVQAAEITRLRAEVEIMQKAIAWANNSLYGSHGFFLSTNGGAPDEHHLDRPIEGLKAEARKANGLRAEVERMREALKPFADEAELWDAFGPTVVLVEPFSELPGSSGVTVHHLRLARAALGDQP